MTIELKRSYINSVRTRYQNSTKRQKTKILDEFCATTKLSRKHSIRALNGKVNLKLIKPGRKAKYSGSEFLFHYITIANMKTITLHHSKICNDYLTSHRMMSFKFWIVLLYN